MAFRLKDIPIKEHNYLGANRLMRKINIKFISVISISAGLAAALILGCWSLQSDTLPMDGVELTRQVILDDMALPNDGHPAGVPKTFGWYYGSYSWWEPGQFKWAKGPYPPEGFTRILAWGQVYPDETLPDVNKVYPKVRVHLKDMEIWILQKDGNWVRKKKKEDAMIDGHAYVSDFAGDEWKKADIRKESDGGISVQAGRNDNGKIYNFHFWPDGGEHDIDPDNIRGVLAVCKARLIGVSGHQNPKYLVSIGADYWKPNTKWDGSDVNNIAVGAGLHKWVTAEWQYFTMHTFAPDEVESVVFPAIGR